MAINLDTVTLKPEVDLLEGSAPEFVMTAYIDTFEGGLALQLKINMVGGKSWYVREPMVLDLSGETEAIIASELEAGDGSLWSVPDDTLDDLVYDIENLLNEAFGLQLF